MKDNLQNNKIDLIVSAAKAAAGTVPIAGSFLSEIIGNIIPNQRVDRLAKYMKNLEDKLTEIPTNKINDLLKNENFIDLIEEGFIQASRAITDERRLYIASIILNGINEESLQLSESKYLLKILSELNDIEIIWLRYFLVPTISGDEDFRNKHENILKEIQVYIDCDNDTMIKAALQRSYKEHLERLELIDYRISLDRSTNMPKFNRFDGKPQKKYPMITTLGKLLLKQIGIIEQLD